MSYFNIEKYKGGVFKLDGQNDSQDIGVVFDFDGIIAHTAGPNGFWLEVEKSLLVKLLNKKLSQSELKEHLCFRINNLGNSPKNIWGDFRSKYHIELDVDGLIAMSESIFQERIDEVQLIPGVVELIATLSQNHCRMAIGSNNSKAIITRILTIYGLESYFVDIVTPQRGIPDKPHPQIWIECIHKLNLTPDRCVIIEDGLPGIQGATSLEHLGLKSILISTTRRDRLNAENIHLCRPTLIEDSISNLSFDVIAALLAN